MATINQALVNTELINQSFSPRSANRQYSDHASQGRASGRREALAQPAAPAMERFALTFPADCRNSRGAALEALRAG